MLYLEEQDPKQGLTIVSSAKAMVPQQNDSESDTNR